MSTEKNTITVDGIEYNEYQVRNLIESENRLRELESDMDYDYESAVKEDVREYILTHFGEAEIVSRLAFCGKDEWASELNDVLFNEDSVTGNASGSYTCSSYRARLYLFNNMYLYEEACKEFGGEPQGGFSEESADVTIRCYLLCGAVSDVLDELEDEFAGKIELYENDAYDNEDE